MIRSYGQQGVYMDFSIILTYLITLAPWVQYVIMGLGSLVVIGTAVDKMFVQFDFMDKLYAIPVLGDLLKALAKFSPFNTRE
jgi:uncharacterized membrane protein